MAETAGGGRGATMVRLARPTDAHAIAEVTVAGWRKAYRGILPDDLLDSLRAKPREMAWQEMLGRDAGGGTPAWVIERDGTVAGFVSCGPPRDEDVPLPAAEVYAIYVRPEAWRLGLGRALLDTASSHFREAGVWTLVLWVLEANEPARTFYEAMGWRPDGARREFEPAGLSAMEVRYRLALG